MRPRSLPLLPILLLATILRFCNLSGQSLWSDEGNSIALARRGFGEIAQRTAFDIHPPLYYWLLKIWITIFDDGEIGLRSLSAVLGIGLVYLIWWLGADLFSRRVGLMAAFIAALSPFLVYYSQEARMYMLLTFLSTLTVVAMLLVLKGYTYFSSSYNSTIFKNNKESKVYFGLLIKGFSTPQATLVNLFYILTVTAGLYTHYAYPIILVVVNITAITQLLITNYQSKIQLWLALQLLPCLLYLPWLPTAWRQITTWPSEQQVASLPKIMATISKTLLVGLSWPFNLSFLIILIFVGTLLITAFTFYGNALHHSCYQKLRSPKCILDSSTLRSPPAVLSIRFSLFLLWLWLLLPVIVTILVFSPAFLKFLLVATPALCLLLAVAIEQIRVMVTIHLLAIEIAPKGLKPVVHLRGRRFLSAQADIAAESPAKATSVAQGEQLRVMFNQKWAENLVCGALLAMVAGLSLLSLYHYYTNVDFARDNYRGIVQFIKAVSGPEDAVILNAEGQQDVFNYYYEQDIGSIQPPVHPLPRRRPLDEAETLAELQHIGDTSPKVYGVYWAAHQADPGGLIEGWLDTNLFKATDQWYGNVRLVSYASPRAGAELKPTPVDYRLGSDIRLTGYALSTPQIAPGDILQVALQWETDEPPAEDYTVFLQILDPANHLVGQRDAQPLVPAPAWPAGEPVLDTHGIFIEPGTPPGKHRLIMGLYNSRTGQRLPVGEGEDFINLGEVEVVSPSVPLPIEAFNIQVPLNESILEIDLLGYDFYKVGHRSTPETPLHPGDPVQLVVYWRLDKLAERLDDRINIRIANNSDRDMPMTITYPLAGTDYPVDEWQPGEIIRAQYDFFLSGLEPGVYRLALILTDQMGTQEVPVVLQSFRVE